MGSDDEEDEDGDSAATAAAVYSMLGCAGDVLFCDWAAPLISCLMTRSVVETLLLPPADIEPLCKPPRTGSASC